MPNPMIRIHNLETNEVVDREMTAAEFENYKAEKLADKAAADEIAVKESAKAELLAKLGITEDEAKLLLG
jgi:hypothetical protein